MPFFTLRESGKHLTPLQPLSFTGPVWRSENNRGVSQVPELFTLPLPAHSIIKAAAVSAQEWQSATSCLWKKIQSALSHQYSSCDTYMGLCFITWNGYCFTVTPPYVLCCSYLFPVKIGQCITGNFGVCFLQYG